MSLSIKKEDTVQVIAGKFRGRQGRVLSVNREKDRILIEKINIIKKHMKPSKTYSQGGIIEKEAPIHLSNVMLVCPKCSKATRVGYFINENGVKTRICKECQSEIS